MRPVSRLLSILLALVLLGASLLTVSAHGPIDVEDDDDYGIALSIGRIDNKTTVKVGTVLTFEVFVSRNAEHSVPFKAQLSSVTGGGFGPEMLGDTLSDSLEGGKIFFSKEVKYLVQPADLGAAGRRTALIQFQLNFVPGHADTRIHNSVTIKSNKVPVVVVRKAETTTEEISEVGVVMDMTPPRRFAEGEDVTFTLAVTTGEFWLFRTKLVRIRKQLYDANGDEIGSSSSPRGLLFIIRPLRTGSQGTPESKKYTLTEDDAAAARIEFSYEFDITFADLRDDDGNPPDLESDFEETFEWSDSIGTAAATSTPGPSASPTPQPVTLVGRTSAARVTRVGDSRIHFDLSRGQDFFMNIGYIGPDGSRGFNRNGYIRDEGLGQTYGVVVRESDNRVVRVWIAPDSAERYQVPWQDVLDFWTFPQSIVNAIPLDEMHPAENQLVDSNGDYYVFTAGAWRHIPDIATFQARSFYWCDMTSADTGWRGRVRIGRPLQSSGTDEIAGYPNCRE